MLSDVTTGNATGIFRLAFGRRPMAGIASGAVIMALPARVQGRQNNTRRSDISRYAAKAFAQAGRASRRSA